MKQQLISSAEGSLHRCTIIKIISNDLFLKADPLSYEVLLSGRPKLLVTADRPYSLHLFVLLHRSPPPQLLHACGADGHERRAEMKADVAGVTSVII
jgi:hypothetical protein